MKIREYRAERFADTRLKTNLCILNMVSTMNLSTFSRFLFIGICCLGFMLQDSEAQQTGGGVNRPVRTPAKRGTVPKTFSGNADSAYVKGEWISTKGDTLRYRLLLPEDYNPVSTYPMILFLHGAGERGSDNAKQLVHGANLFLQPGIRKDFPAIIVFPQCPTDDFWANVDMRINDTTKKREFVFSEGGEPRKIMQLLLDWLPEFEKKYPVKRDQRYVMGLSMGGMGTFELVRRKPRFFAAAVPICGGANPATAGAMKETAFWIFHGNKDDVVPYQLSENMALAFQEFYVSAEVNFTIFNNVGHNSWDPAFAEPDLLPWLFSQQLKK
jgi:predicted peptidase